MLTWMSLWSFIKCLLAHIQMMIKTEFDYKGMNFKILIFLVIFKVEWFVKNWSIINFQLLTHNAISWAIITLSFCHHYKWKIYICDVTHSLILIPQTFPHTWFIKRLMQTWHFLRVKKFERILCFLLFTMHINFPSLSILERKNFSLYCRRLWWLSESLKACAHSLEYLDHISPLLLLFINTFFTSAYRDRRDFWDFHSHSPNST